MSKIKDNNQNNRKPAQKGLSCPVCTSLICTVWPEIEANTGLVKDILSFEGGADFYCMDCGYEGDDANGDIDPLMLLGGICRMLHTLLPQEVEVDLIIHTLYNDACNAYEALEALDE